MRIEDENATDQVLARGNRREAIFRDDRDRTEFLRRLEIVCGRMGWSIRAYVLMGNHQGKDHAEKQAMGILTSGSCNIY